MTIRIDDAENPHRLEKLTAALKTTGQRFPDVMRQAAEAYTRYVAVHGHAPPAGWEIAVPAKRRKRN